MAKKTVAVVIGTRPEALKMIPVVKALQQTDWADVRIINSAQHRDLLDSLFALFGIVPDIDLNVMTANQTLPELTSRLITRLDGAFAQLNPDVVLVQGDTTTVFAAGLASFYRRIPVGHVEAGLRTHHPYNPFPEEMNRVLVSKLTKWHFAPTEGSQNNLLAEGIAQEAIQVTGNTVIDMLLDVVNTVQLPDLGLLPGLKTILVTSHRRENFGEPLQNIIAAVRHLLTNRSDIQVLFPVHPNPNVRKVVHEALGDLPNCKLTEPLDYLSFVAAMQQATVVLTDSGGVQEEAPALGKPVLVLREDTERPEAVEAGVARLVGADRQKIIQEVETLLDDPKAYAAMARDVSPYGDGLAAQRICAILEAALYGNA